MWYVMENAQSSYMLSDRLIRAISNWRISPGPEDDVENLIERGITKVQIRKFYERKIVIIFLPINLKMCFRRSKELLTYVLGAQRTVSLSTHNICFVLEIRKLF